MRTFSSLLMFFSSILVADAARGATSVTDEFDEWELVEFPKGNPRAACKADAIKQHVDTVEECLQACIEDDKCVSGIRWRPGVTGSFWNCCFYDCKGCCPALESSEVSNVWTSRDVTWCDGEPAGPGDVNTGTDPDPDPVNCADFDVRRQCIKETGCEWAPESDSCRATGSEPDPDPTGPTDCTWNDWDTCSATCGAGSRRRSRNEADIGGNDCEGSAVEACDEGRCPVDCTWNDWETCSVTCGDGIRRRTRNEADVGGKDCVGNASEACNEGVCGTDCTWEDWGACSVTCGDGTRRRSRNRAQNGGADCVGNPTESCNEGDCPEDCTWGDWDACSVTCGDGTRQRSRNRAKNGGADCDGEPTEPCYAGLCESDKEPFGTCPQADECFSANEMPGFDSAVQKVIDDAKAALRSQLHALYGAEIEKLFAQIKQVEDLAFAHYTRGTVISGCDEKDDKSVDDKDDGGESDPATDPVPSPDAQPVPSPDAGGDKNGSGGSKKDDPCNIFTKESRCIGNPKATCEWDRMTKECNLKP